jgi:hypothetical protein
VRVAFTAPTAATGAVTTSWVASSVVCGVEPVAATSPKCTAVALPRFEPVRTTCVDVEGDARRVARGEPRAPERLTVVHFRSTGTDHRGGDPADGRTWRKGRGMVEGITATAGGSSAVPARTAGRPAPGAPALTRGTVEAPPAQAGASLPQAPAARRPERPASDQDAAATSRYLQQLFTAQVLGGSVDPSARPARIAPEHLAPLIALLERCTVDVTG